MRYPHLDVVVELDAKSGTTMGLSSLSKTKPSGGREEELRNPHLDVVVELDAKSGTSAGTVAPPNTFDVVAELDVDAKSGTTIGLSSLSKTKPSGGREEELRNPHLDVLVELDVKSGTSAGTVAPPNTFDVGAELDAEPDVKSGTTMG